MNTTFGNLDRHETRVVIPDRGRGETKPTHVILSGDGEEVWVQLNENTIPVLRKLADQISEFLTDEANSQHRLKANRGDDLKTIRNIGEFLRAIGEGEYTVSRIRGYGQQLLLCEDRLRQRKPLNLPVLPSNGILYLHGIRQAGLELCHFKTDELADNARRLRYYGEHVLHCVENLKGIRPFAGRYVEVEGDPEQGA